MPYLPIRAQSGESGAIPIAPVCRGIRTEKYHISRHNWRSLGSNHPSRQRLMNLCVAYYSARFQSLFFNNEVLFFKGVSGSFRFNLVLTYCIFNFYIAFYYACLYYVFYECIYFTSGSILREEISPLEKRLVAVSKCLLEQKDLPGKSIH